MRPACHNHLNPLTIKQQLMSIKHIIATSLLALAPLAACAQGNSMHQLAARPMAKPAGESLVVTWRMTMDSMRIRSNQTLVFTPVIEDKHGHTQTLRSIMVNGRRQHYVFLRNGNKHYPDAIELQRHNGTAQCYNYREAIDLEPWMNDATLRIATDTCGCGNLVGNSAGTPVDINPHWERKCALANVMPAVSADDPVLSLQGKAYLDFPVNRTELHPDYHNNAAELHKIMSTIDTVRHNPNVSITSISIHGYASPEGSWTNNARLAQGRAATLKEYVRNQYDIPAKTYHVDFTPEDWAGLDTFIVRSNMADKQALLGIVRADMDPDAKDAQLKQRYPEAYSILLNACYPYLRHSDYEVKYKIRPMSDREAAALISTEPRLLSLTKMYRIAALYEPGSDQVGFLEGTYNPAEMPDFGMWYDSIRRYVTAEPQLYFRMFTDKAFRRQVLSQTERPLQHKAMLYFAAARPKITRLRFDSIPADRVIVDPQTVGRDTIALWFNVPSSSLPDTIKGEITYFKHDTVNQLQEVTEPLKLAWRLIETKEQEREREKLERERRKAEAAGEEWVEPKKENPFAFKMPTSGEINPENHLTVDFDYPLVKLDSAELLLTRVLEDNSIEDIPVRMVRDTGMLRRWQVRAPWKLGGQYTLTIPEGAITDVAGLSNDSIIGKYTVLDPEKFATVLIHVRGRDDGTKYIVQLLDGSNALKQEKRDVTTGDIRFNYVPAGEIKFRVIEDRNGNGKWDSGNVVERLQPERAEIYANDQGEDTFATKTNWEIEFSMDMNRIFAPVTMQSLSRLLDERESQRLRREAEKRAKEGPKRDQDRNRQQNDNNSNFNAAGGMFNNFR